MIKWRIPRLYPIFKIIQQKRTPTVLLVLWGCSLIHPQGTIMAVFSFGRYFIQGCFQVLNYTVHQFPFPVVLFQLSGLSEQIRIRCQRSATFLCVKRLLHGTKQAIAANFGKGSPERSDKSGGGKEWVCTGRSG